MNFLYNLNQSPDLLFVILRALILFFLGIFILRFGNRRYNLDATFDYLLLIALGGLLSRGMNGPATLLSTIVCVLSLIFFHRVVAIMTCNSELCGRFIKGVSHLIISNGKLQKETLQSLHLTERDIIIEMRSQLFSEDISKIKAAYLERTGRISFVLEEVNNSD